MKPTSNQSETYAEVLPANGGFLRIRRRTRWMVVVGMAGVAISLLVFLQLRHREYELAKTEFTLNAEKRVQLIERSLRDQFSVLTAMEAFYLGSEMVEREEFHIFAGKMLAEDDDIRALGWIEPVDDAHRETHEQTARAEGVENYQITERAADGNLVAAGRRDLYFPLYYLESARAAGEILGLDLGVRPEMRALIRRSRESGMMAAGATRPLLNGKGPPYVLVAIAPVFDDPQAEIAALRRRIMPDGFAVGIFRIDMIVADVRTYLKPAGVNTYLFAAAEEGAVPVAVELSRLGRKPTVARTALPWDDLPPMSVLREFELGLNRWTVFCEPMQDYLATYRTWAPWAVLLAGLSLTAMFVGYLVLLARHAAELERIAGQRTAELNTFSNAALDALVMMDPQGNVAHWNAAAERIFGYRREEILGQTVHAILVPEQHRQRAAAGMRRFAASGEGNVVGRVVELTALRKDGTEFPIEISVASIHLRDGWWAVAIVRDITKRKQAEKALERERRVLRHMVDLQERDRRLVSFEIHDGLTQQLAGAVMRCEALGGQLSFDAEETKTQFNELQRLVGDALREARRLISGLRPPVLDESGVVAAIDNLVEEESLRAQTEIEFEHDVRFDRLAPPLEIAVFRVVQEALTNACRYSHSKRIKVALTQPNGTVRVEVRDWGVGFDPEKVEPGHFGLEGMRERARLLGGSAQIVTGPGKGVRVCVELPLLEEETLHNNAL